jgi:pimeloyl-ACP methyl ester carboxylesterase
MRKRRAIRLVALIGKSKLRSVSLFYHLALRLLTFDTTKVFRRRLEITKPQTLIGALSQMAACSTHHVSPSRLQMLSSSIPKVVIATGDQDNLVNPRNSWYLKEHIPEAEYVVFEGTGHVLHTQRTERFNALLVRVFQEGSGVRE